MSKGSTDNNVKYQNTVVSCINNFFYCLLKVRNADKTPSDA